VSGSVGWYLHSPLWGRVKRDAPKWHTFYSRLFMKLKSQSEASFGPVGTAGLPGYLTVFFVIIRNNQYDKKQSV
jgi:hypothetical protein